MDTNTRKRLMSVSWLLFATTLVVLAYIGIQIKRTQEQFKVLTENELRLNGLGGQIMHLDELLTMSTHMAVATGDMYWEERYYEDVAELDSVLAEVRDLAPHIYESEANRITESANVELVCMEMEAFDSVRAGNLDAASAIVTGRTYQEQKRIYSEGIDHLMFGIDLSVRTKLNKFRMLMHTMLISIGVVVLCVVLQWGIVLRCSRNS